MSTPIADAQKFHSTDVSAERIARVYAEALYQAVPEGQTDSIGEELGEMVNQTFREEPALQTFLASGIISNRKKAEFIETQLRGKASDTFVDFLHIVNNHMRLSLLGSIWRCYQQVLNEKKRRVRVQVRSAVALDDAQRDKLKADVRSAFKLDPILFEQVDPELLGGLILRVGDWQYDGSLQARLNHLKNQLLERSSHEIQSRRDRFCTL
jgi:F-type H+-transporting ATPase subunit delta